MPNLIMPRIWQGIWQAGHSVQGACALSLVLLAWNASQAVQVINYITVCLPKLHKAMGLLFTPNSHNLWGLILYLTSVLRC